MSLKNKAEISSSHDHTCISIRFLFTRSFQKWEDVKEGQQFVVDIVEAHLSPSGRTEKELMQPYLAAADAVLIIVNSSDNATLLSALSTSNILKNRGVRHSCFVIL